MLSRIWNALTCCVSAIMTSTQYNKFFQRNPQLPFWYWIFMVYWQRNPGHAENGTQCVQILTYNFFHSLTERPWADKWHAVRANILSFQRDRCHERVTTCPFWFATRSLHTTFNTLWLTEKPWADIKWHAMRANFNIACLYFWAVFSPDVTEIQITKLLILRRRYFNDV